MPGRPVDWFLSVGLRLIVRMWDQDLLGGAIREGLSKGSLSIFTRVSEKTTENSKWLGRQARPGIQPGTSHLAVLRAELLGH